MNARSIKTFAEWEENGYNYICSNKNQAKKGIEW